MSTKELDRAAVMARLSEHSLSQRAAAEMLQLTVRQVRRLQRAYAVQGGRGSRLQATWPTKQSQVSR
ncbi:MAG: helix-turn-helix domain-containing protein [Sandaracinaceae bacterium]|nr:helix-turn-helix domain-containing protein [Sandaracinaceae bacterium]